jgi:hypothetical protein
MDKAPSQLRNELLREYNYIKNLKNSYNKFPHTTDDIKNGLRFSFTNFIIPFKDNPNIITWYGFETIHKDKRILIDDYYCLNPKCRCKDVELIFLMIKTKRGANTLECLFTTNMSLKTGRLQHPKTVNCSLSYANAILAAWKTEMDSTVLKHMKWRHKTMRISAKRALLKNHRKQMPVPVPSIESMNDSRENRIKRNDPCPCGSGKKYKKCCLK